MMQQVWEKIFNMTQQYLHYSKCFLRIDEVGLCFETKALGREEHEGFC